MHKADAMTQPSLHYIEVLEDIGKMDLDNIALCKNNKLLKLLSNINSFDNAKLGHGNITNSSSLLLNKKTSSNS